MLRLQRKTMQRKYVARIPNRVAGEKRKKRYAELKGLQRIERNGIEKMRKENIYREHASIWRFNWFNIRFPIIV